MIYVISFLKCEPHCYLFIILIFIIIYLRVPF